MESQAMTHKPEGRWVRRTCLLEGRRVGCVTWEAGNWSLNLTGIAASMTSSSRICVVTGANKGIGYGIMKELCQKFDGIVYLTARNEERGKAAVAELNKLGYNPSFHLLDIDSKDSINTFAEYLKETYGGLDVLVNNAAIAYKVGATEPFEEQAENTVRTNYFGTLNVCHALFPLLRPHARVVHVSSSAGHLLRMNGKEPESSGFRTKLASPDLTEEDLSSMMNDFIRAAKAGTWKEEGWQSNTYSVSKVGVSALARIQQRAFDEDPRPDIVVNSCHPGYVSTDMSSHKGPASIEEGAVCPSYLALLPNDVEEPRGGYLWSQKQIVDWVHGPIPVRF
ncbi:carbonyl reductase [NADPH] 1-like isoform X2 [Oratosquilla oratoria]|uniref:carbonyl reductase [NADPH] 1-like isoform X2 n=1 Tax=Oratosquilla oratoria TaxID=337810 RepID=UPI003F75827A